MLSLHRSERADALVSALAEVLAAAGDDPFTREIVAVPSMGVERWLAQRLSHRLGAVDGDGVCANVAFPSSTRLLDDAAAAADDTYAATVEAWAADRSVWPLMGLLDEHVGSAEWAAALALHLGTPATAHSRRFAVASTLARHFERYASSRPSMLLDWAAHREDLPDDLAWQAQLWRLLRAELGPSPAESLEQACTAMRAQPGRIDLPARLSIFGTTRISPSRMTILDALADQRDVHLWLHHPSPELWRLVATSGATAGARRADRSGEQLHHPLLASLSRDVRELQLLLPPAAHDTHHPIGARPDTVLGRLQAQLAADEAPARPTPAAPGDRSLAVHACHGAARQVEVVRESVLGLLRDDPTLEPRDVLIMCPDVETFAPLVAASFGMVDEPGGHPAAQLRVRLADRSLRQTNPLLSLLGQLLDLAGRRMTATEVLDLAGTPAVRALFGFTDDDVEQVRDWAVAANARWGLDAHHRAAYRLDSLAQGTWRAAMDRLLVGVAMEEDARWIGDVLPLDDVDSGDIDLAGRLAELIDRLELAVDTLARTRPVGEWAEVLGDLVLSLGAPDQAWQEAQLRGELADLAEAAGETQVPLARADIAALLGSRLAGRPTRASFRTGTLTVCTLVPMRSVPHRVVCLLGMDDGVFPRNAREDGDDVLAREPRVGERDVRSEDRQLFLDAICAAEEHLLITYTGADPRSGAPVPPCVPLGELLDAVDAGVLGPDGAPGREHVMVHHPLQPFDARNFRRDALGAPAPFSFDPGGLAGARAAAGERRPPLRLVSAPLAPPAAADVDLEDLVRFVQHPARAFLRQRLQLSTYTDDDDPDDAVPVELDGLQKYAVGERMLRSRIAGRSRQECSDIERRRGELPPGALGDAVLRDVGMNVDALLEACAQELAQPPRSVDIAVRLDDGRLLTGTVPGVRERTVLSVGYSTLGPRQRLAAWVRYLAVVAAVGDQTWRSVAVGRRGRHARRSVLFGVNGPLAVRVLSDLAQLRDDGLRGPLPMAAQTSEAYAVARHAGRDHDAAFEAAHAKWQADRFANENAENEHRLVFDGIVDLRELMSAPDSSVPGEPTRFGALAVRLWGPLLEVESS